MQAGELWQAKDACFVAPRLVLLIQLMAEIKSSGVENAVVLDAI